MAPKLSQQRSDAGSKFERTSEGSGCYKENPVRKHLRLKGMEPSLFDRWMGLFAQTCRELFVDDVVIQFIVTAQRIADSLKLALLYRPDRPWPRTPS